MPEAEKKRTAVRDAIVIKKFGVGTHGVEMNKRCNFNTVATDGQMEPVFELDAELHCQPTAWPDARLPQVRQGLSRPGPDAVRRHAGVAGCAA
ncbi:hypothetical protein [Leisingera aquimarina]|uniref:hypothetical protein n=1 Tax=Leisingera aquimarina TaxID=476529 RepID=UPI00041CB0CC|nr:hypothetical protein [Leisingera aquimarina]